MLDLWVFVYFCFFFNSGLFFSLVSFVHTAVGVVVSVVCDLPVIFFSFYSMRIGSHAGLCHHDHHTCFGVDDSGISFSCSSAKASSHQGLSFSDTCFVWRVPSCYACSFSEADQSRVWHMLMAGGRPLSLVHQTTATWLSIILKRRDAVPLPPSEGHFNWGPAHAQEHVDDGATSLFLFCMVSQVIDFIHLRCWTLLGSWCQGDIPLVPLSPM